MELQERIKECRQGSGAAQKCLFDLWAPRMLLLCRRYVKNPEDAEERMLDGFFKFFKSLSHFHYQSEAETWNWIKRIMINECLMFMRKKNLLLMATDNELEDIQWEDNSLNNLSSSEIFKLIIQLPAGYRTVFNLFAVEGMTHLEISKILGITEGTSKSQLSKARALLKKMLVQNHAEYVRRKAK